MAKRSQEKLLVLFDLIHLMAILGANRLLATLDIPPRMSIASKLFAPNLDKRRVVANHTYAVV